MPPLPCSPKIPSLNFLLIESVIIVKGPYNIIVLAPTWSTHRAPVLSCCIVIVRLSDLYAWFPNPLITDVCSHFSHSNSHILVSVFLDQCFQSRACEWLWWIQGEKEIIQFYWRCISLTPLCFTCVLWFTCIKTGIYKLNYRLNIYIICNSILKMNSKQFPDCVYALLLRLKPIKCVCLQ